jgi:hypothetical protein
MPFPLRWAAEEDVEGLLTLREARAWAGVAGAGGRSAGGFLLGCTREQYREHVAAGAVLLGVGPGRDVAGFSVVWDDARFRASALFERRQRAEVPPALVARLLASRVAYFDQLVTLPGRPWLAARLAYAHLCAAMRAHDAVLATTVTAPVVNEAALPFLAAMGFAVVGSLSERYAQVGDVRSAVYLLEAATLHERRRAPVVRRFERIADRAPAAA